MKSIKTSLLFASVLLSAGVAFAASGPNASQTEQLDTNKYDLDSKKPIENEEKLVVLVATGNAYSRIVYEVQAKALPTVLIVQEEGAIISQAPVRGTRWDVVEKQNSFQYKYKPKKSRAAAE